jgi:hypothetical protein
MRTPRRLALVECIACPAVAQVSNLLYRRLLAGYALNNRGLGGLEIRDTADWKSALHCAIRRTAGQR